MTEIDTTPTPDDIPEAIVGAAPLQLDESAKPTVLLLDAPHPASRTSTNGQADAKVMAPSDATIAAAIHRGRRRVVARCTASYPNFARTASMVRARRSPSSNVASESCDGSRESFDSATPTRRIGSGRVRSRR